MNYFKHKYYLTHNNIRVAHVHILGNEYKVCGHYKRFAQFKRRTFDKAGFEEFIQKNNLVIEL
ncbi:hypothetical protein XA22_13735 [Staphylococcus cohnii subsp. cohnii]|nr:hypothetical protein XA22_13735 [Staphylococcus cohnii subsp. cohnii]KKD25201.1 hypothetical protein XA21_02825 [Staphylococcus cohnii subsp. cohnii]